MFGFGISGWGRGDGRPLEKAVPGWGDVIIGSWYSWDAIFWEGMQSWQEKCGKSRCPGDSSSLRAWPGMNSMSWGCRNPSAGAGTFCSPHKPQNWKTSSDLTLEYLQGSIPKHFQTPHILLTANPPQLSSLLMAVFILPWIYFGTDHQQTAPHA